MSAKVNSLVARRKALVDAAALNREQLSVAYQELHQPFRIADVVINAAQVVRKRPWLVAVGAAVVGAFFPRPFSQFNRLRAAWSLFKGIGFVWHRFTNR